MLSDTIALSLIYNLLISWINPSIFSITSINCSRLLLISEASHIKISPEDVINNDSNMCWFKIFFYLSTTNTTSIWSFFNFSSLSVFRSSVFLFNIWLDKTFLFGRIRNGLKNLKKSLVAGKDSAANR